MNYVVIKAGGIGVRMQPSDAPKQFIKVHGKPIIVYTLECFQKSNDIDEICIACLEDWIGHMWELVNIYNLTKVKKIVVSGVTSHLSIRNGVYALKGTCKDDDIVIIHDAVRPLFDDALLHDTIHTAKIYGAAIACSQCIESVFYSENGIDVEQHQPNYKFYRAQAPQAYMWKNLLWAYEKADNLQIYDVLSTDHLYSYFDIPQKIVLGGQHNFKITTPEDVDIFSKIVLGMKKRG